MTLYASYKDVVALKISRLILQTLQPLKNYTESPL